jgi:glutamate formiminotransferase
VLECVPNVSEGRDPTVLGLLADACGASLLDLHRDADHNRSVFTLAGPGPRDAGEAARRLALAVDTHVDLRRHTGVHPRLGALDVVPFVALGEPIAEAAKAAQEFAEWVATTLAVPVFRYDACDPMARPLPSVRREAFTVRPPDIGPREPHPRLGAVAVGARPPLVALNCWLDTDDVALARRIAQAVRERDGGLPGVRAMGVLLSSRRVAQVSMNVTDLEATGVEAVCTAVRERVEAAGRRIDRVELVGLVPAAEYARWSDEFRAWTGLDERITIEARLAGEAPPAVTAR